MIFFARLEGVFWLVGYYSVFSRGILVSLKAISLSIFFDFFDKKRQIFKFTLLESFLKTTPKFEFTPHYLIL